MVMPIADRRPAPGPCQFCNWRPDAAHPNVPGADWGYVVLVDPTTWICPACGMPNDYVEPPLPTIEELLAASATVADAAPESAAEGRAVPADAVEEAGGSVTPSPEPPAPTDPQEPADGPADVPTAPETVELAPGPVELPAAEDALLGQLGEINALVATITTTTLPALCDEDVHPVQVAMLIQTLIGLEQWLHSSTITVMEVLGTAIAVLTPADEAATESETP